QPYAEDASPIAQSLEYVPESDFEIHPEDDDDEDPEEDHVDYPADGGDDGDDEEESSEDDEEDEDDEMDIEADDDEEEEEHPAPADSVVVAPTAADQAPSAKETEPFETDKSAATPPPHPAFRTTGRISIPAPVPMPTWTDSEVVRLLAISSPPASPLSPWSSPPPQIPFSPLPPILSQHLPVLSPAPPPSPIRSLGYRAAMIRLRDEAASTSHSPPLQLPSASRREDRPEVTLPPRKRLDIALGPRYEGAPVSTDTELGGYVREFETRVRQDTNEIYMRLDDEQTERQLLAGRLNMLFRDRRAHAYTRQLMETEARMSGEAWVRATDASNLVHGEVISLRTTVLGQMSEIKELQAADRRRQTVISELLWIDHRRSTKISELRTALQGQSDFDAHLEDDDDEDPEKDPVDYLADGGDDGDDEEGSSKDDDDDEDDDMDIEADEEEEEEHPSPADSSAATPPPYPAYRMTARISIPAPVPMSAWSDSEIVRLLAMSSPPASPLSPWSSPPPQIPFLLLSPILSPPSPVLSPAPPPRPICSLGYLAAMIRLRAEAASTSSPPLQLPSASRREDRSEVTLPFRKKLGIALGPGYEVGESSSAAAARPAGGLRADYGFVATMDREIMRDPERELPSASRREDRSEVTLPSRKKLGIALGPGYE
nr:hypothetical protein [Tanacetum cinerariifolium]